MNQYHHQHISNDFGQKQVYVWWVLSFIQQVAQVFANPTARSTKVSSRFSHQPDQKNLVRRGEEATLNLFLHNWPCVWSLGWKTLCLSKSYQNFVFNLGKFSTAFIVIRPHCETQFQHAHLKYISGIK